MKRIVIFASGSGTNTENIIRYFKDHSRISISLVLSNNPKASVLDKANQHNISALSFNKISFLESDIVLSLLSTLSPDLIVLAGFLWKIPAKMINLFSDKMINIHPSLLPLYGGKGMYGIHVHEAVHKAQAKQTGITIHYVNADYDQGTMIRQEITTISPTDTPKDIAHKVHQLEYEYYPKTIESLLL